ncbi:MAG: adenylate/guanylate cyclase domain-containing protein [Nocardioidaceae bacterium]
MPALPEGTVTMLFSDIEGSTALLRRLGSRWGDALSAQRSLLRTVWAEHSGHEMGTEGDSFFVVFGSAHDAISAAIAGQSSLQAYPWPDGAPVRVRMGVHTGEPQRHDDGYIGLDVHRAARISGTAHGGQIVASEPTCALVTDIDAELRDLGWHRLKDVPEAEHLHDVVVAGLRSDFPPLRSLGTPASLPTSPTELLGRDGELALLTGKIRDGARLVTLTGPGGSGKTRLGLEVARRVDDEFPHGVYFVPEHTADRAALMWAEIADALDAGGDPEESPRQRAISFLATRRVLLLLDNLEQIPDADVVVSALLSDAPDVAVLATSRRPLHLVAEHEHPVPPLTLPEVSDEAGSVGDAGAVQLFVRRTRMTSPAFALTPANAADVAALCRRLDGLPLAIELAAARSRLLSPKALLARIDDRLGSGVTASDRPERQRTIGATIAWSHDLLAEQEQIVFRRLGALQAPCDIDAVEAVAGSCDQDDAAGVDALDMVAKLVDLSLVKVVEGADGEPLVTMLETVRAFARERLAESGEEDEVRMRHLRWCLGVARRADGLLQSMSPSTGVDLVATVEDDVRAALDWSLRPVAEVGRDRLESGYALLQPMTTYWYRFGYLQEGRGWFERAVALSDGNDSSGALTALHGLGVVLLQRNEVSAGIDALERSLDMARRLENRDLEARELNSLAIAMRSAAETERARDLLEQSVTIAREIGSDDRESTALSNLVVILYDLGDYESSARAGRAAVSASRRSGSAWAAAIDSVNLALALLRAEGPEESYAQLSSVAADVVACGDAELIIDMLEVFVCIAAERGDPLFAARVLGAIDRERAASGLPRPGPDQSALDISIRPARARVSGTEWDTAYQSGLDLPVERAVAENLELSDAKSTPGLSP